jgi:hypothetical protein
VPGNLVALLVGRAIDERWRRRKRRGTGRAPGRPAAARVKPDLGRRLSGQPFLLDRPGVVPRDCIALLFEPDRPPRLLPPRSYLKPPAFPFRQPIQVMVVNSAPVVLDLTITDLVTMDGYRIDRVVIRMTVQLSDREDFRGLRDRAAEFGVDFEQPLLDQVRLEVMSQVLAAVRMNRLADLRRLSLYRVLAEDWMPSWFAGRTLVGRSFEIRKVVWPVGDSASQAATPAAEHPRAGAPQAPFLASTASTASIAPAASSGLAPQRLDLTMDAKLRRLWLREGDSDLRGIAGAKIEASATVIAVPGSAPGAYANNRLAELFGQHFEDRKVKVVAAVATDYDQLVRAWFSQVASGADRLVSVESAGDDAVLRITVDHPSGAANGPAPQVGSQSDREALRQLLPHRKVEFVTPSAGR